MGIQEYLILFGFIFIKIIFLIVIIKVIWLLWKYPRDIERLENKIDEIIKSRDK